MFNNGKAHEVRITTREEFFAESETIETMDAVGRVSGKSLCLNPPVFLTLELGEMATEWSDQVLTEFLEAGDSTLEASDDTLSTIRVIIE